MNARRKTIRHAQDLRKSQTGAEEKLWIELRAGRLGGLKFRRQHPVPPYSLDFANRPLKLAIEIDGATHGTDEERAYDARRSEFLEDKGWTIIRFWNDEVYDHMDSVLDGIWQAARALEAKT